MNQQAKSRRVTGYTPPTRSRQEKAREDYDKERAKRKRCRESKPSPETCKACTFERACPTEATEDWINKSKESDDSPEDPVLAA